MKNNVQKAVILSIVVLLLTSCGGSDPESIGKAISEKECACDKEQQERYFPKNMKAHQQLLSEVNEGKFKTRDGYNNRKYKLLEDVYDRDKAQLCNKEIEKMKQDAEIKFVEQNDRQTIMNSYRANLRICEEENTKVRQNNNAAIDKVEEELNTVLAAKLPYK